MTDICRKGKSDLVVPLEALPENLRESMGSSWRHRTKNREILEGKK